MITNERAMRESPRMYLGLSLGGAVGSQFLKGFHTNPVGGFTDHEVHASVQSIRRSLTAMHMGY